MSLLICSTLSGGCGFIGKNTEFIFADEDWTICPKCNEDHVFGLTERNIHEVTDEENFDLAREFLNQEVLKRNINVYLDLITEYRNGRKSLEIFRTEMGLLLYARTESFSPKIENTLKNLQNLIGRNADQLTLESAMDEVHFVMIG